MKRYLFPLLMLLTWHPLLAQVPAAPLIQAAGSAASPAGQVVALTWTNPAANTDTSVLAATAITQTRITYGGCGGASPVFQSSVMGQFTAAGGVTHANSPVLTPGTYCFIAFTTALEPGGAVEGPGSNAAQGVVVAGTTTPVTVATTAYMEVPRVNGFGFLAIATVPLGTPCDPTQFVNSFMVVLAFDPTGKALTDTSGKSLVTWTTPITGRVVLLAACQ